MDYADLFERQGRTMDELLLHAFRVTPEQFVAPGTAGGPSLRDLLVEWLETQRRAVHVSLQGGAHRPLPSGSTATVLALAQSFGGFRLTLLETLEEVFREDLSRKVPWVPTDRAASDGSTSAREPTGGAATEVALDDVLAHLVLHGARMMGLVAARLRELGASPPPTDLL